VRIEQVKRLKNTERFLYWIEEREAIRCRKTAGQLRPWTDDEILQKYRFCNVRRMDDKVSTWLLQNWYLPNYDHPHMLVACTIARHFNQPLALEAIGFPKDWKPLLFKGILRELKRQGERIFNAAYMVRGIGTTDKTEMVIDKVCQPLVNHPPILDLNSMRKSVEALLPYWGFSSFMAGQVVADLRWAVAGTWRDRKTWAPVGPGSVRGMNRLYDRPYKTSLLRQQFEQEFGKLLVLCSNELPNKIYSRLEAIDLQNCLCEWDKYERALWGQGRPKQLYSGLPT
jgi:hypothetical protein